MAAPKISINVLVKCKIRDPDRFHQTIAYNDAWHVVTDLDNYMADLEIPIQQIEDFRATEASLLATVGAHFSVTLENITAAPPPTGGLVQAKGHFDGELTPEEFTGDYLYNTLDSIIQYLKNYAKY